MDKQLFDIGLDVLRFLISGAMPADDLQPLSLDGFLSLCQDLGAVPDVGDEAVLPIGQDRALLKKNNKRFVLAYERYLLSPGEHTRVVLALEASKAEGSGHVFRASGRHAANGLVQMDKVRAITLTRKPEPAVLGRWLSKMPFRRSEVVIAGEILVNTTAPQAVVDEVLGSPELISAVKDLFTDGWARVELAGNQTTVRVVFDEALENKHLDVERAIQRLEVIDSRLPTVRYDHPDNG